MNENIIDIDTVIETYLKKLKDNNTIFNESDIALIKIHKKEFIKQQKYEVAANLRDIENKILIRIDSF